MMRKTDNCKCNFICDGKTNTFYTTYNIYKVLRVSLSHENGPYVDTDKFYFVDNEVHCNDMCADGDCLLVEYIGTYEEKNAKGISWN